MRRLKIKNVILLIIVLIGLISIPKLLSKMSGNKLYINEILPSNKSVLLADGDYYDYIELYNNSNKPINLKGYYLSDSESDLTKWTFPDIEIKENGYLTILASGFDLCKEYCHTNFKLSKNKEIVILSDPNENIVSKVEYPEIKSDTSYGYVNGKYKVLYTPTPNKENIDIEYSKTSLTDKDIEISEFITNNKGITYDNHGNCYDWVELHNISGNDISLENVYISDDENNLAKYKIPIIPLKKDEYVVLYFSKESVDYTDAIYIPFSLSKTDKSIIISNGEKIITSINIVNLPDNVSYGKVNDEFKFFSTPTPGKENNTAYYDIKQG